MTITPARAAKLLALLPEPGGNTFIPKWETPHGDIVACWPVLVAAPDAR